ncbi:hypothetical protein C2845_PM05G37860 [Panicum miliaceum]|uniref:Receptor-like serine/threonine-protein kinase n=1 Tax=Panicum miliaceum TaxID=4540 RepID=A0A3L6SUD9_PANMI|nr:hypothetical protein C2845_PM05G37860 [Panicum miliaceum]
MAGPARASPLLGFFLVLVAAHVSLPVRAQDTVAAGRPLSGDAKLVSRGGKFALGFFQPDGGVSGSWYVGIWYNNIAVRTPVWVANRERPVPDPAASRLAIVADGNLALLDPWGSPVWSTNTTTNGNATAAVLLDTGNLVLAPAANVSDVLWQSFDHIGDTWLPGGKLRRDKANGAIQGMTSWRARGDPAPGAYTLQLDPAGAPQYVLRWNGTREYWLTGDWNGRFFTGAPEVAASGGSAGYSFRFVDNERESYFTYNFADNSTVYRFVTDVSGQVKGWFWVEAWKRWNLVYAEPKARCAVPRACGAFGVCSDAAATACGCARGFAPRDAASWSLGDHTGGCVRNAELRCGQNGSAAAGSETKEDRFFRMDDIRLPDGGRVVGAASSGECERACLGDCSCSGYTYNGSCVLWNSELQNLADGYGGQPGAGSLYLRLAASEFPNAKSHRRRTVEIAVGALAVVCFVLAASILIVRATMARRTKKVQGLTSAEGSVTSFKYRDLLSLTKNFSDKLGGGAFGSVFRGQLLDGTAIAVKKLEGLRQGEKQFRAEVSTLGTIQHVNLIRLLGFCSEGGDRKLLVYEFMPNGSLDRHLFGTTLYTLSWRARYHIAVGVAKGLAYLHDKCRDCIIHCDVKPENILLDADLAPKVADFGLAKLVGRDFSRVLTTMRGTIGYLAPEWIGGEAITAKADVFSYGMMLFEIVSGRRNVEHGRSEPPDSSSSGAGDHAATATFFPVLAARRLAEADGDVMALLDPELGGDANVEEVRRVCKVACWCIQHGVDARPTMAEVVQALEGLTDFEMPPVPRYLEVLAGRPMHMHPTQ